MKILEVKNCKKIFDNRPVLDDISFSLEEGKTLSIIGRSGGGKSTILRVVSFLEDMDEGEIYYDGKLVYKVLNGKKECFDLAFYKQIKNHIGFVFQNFNLFPHYTVLKNIIDAPLVVQKRNKEEVINEAKEILSKVGLSHKMNAYPDSLSGGEKQRVAIARALMMKPRVLFFDEPTSALDPELTKEVLKVIKMLSNEKYTMIIVTHEMEFAKIVSDEVMFLSDGKIEVKGSVKDVFEDSNNERLVRFLQK